MKEALKEAELAAARGEIPIGAVVVKDGKVIGRGHNQTEFRRDATAHAEMLALRDAARTLGGWRLAGCSLFVTVEPCSMCAGALVLSRIETVYIGAMDPKAGAFGSVYNIGTFEKLNHRVRVESGILEEECRGVIQRFFRELRKKKSEERT